MREELRTAFSPRQYMLSKDFEIYYYSDIHMKSTGSHTHDYYEFYFFINGDVSMIIADKTYPLTSGDLVLIPPHVPHYAIIHNTDIYYQRFVFWISKEYCNQLLRISPAYGYIMQQASVNKQYVYHFDTIAFNAIQSKIFNLLQEIHQDRYGKAAKIQKGSGVPNKTKVATVTTEDVRKIAETKMPDLNAVDIEGAMSMIAGTARSMGIVVKD